MEMTFITKGSTFGLHTWQDSHFPHRSRLSVTILPLRYSTPHLQYHVALQKGRYVPLQIIFLLYPPTQRKQTPGLPGTSQGSLAVRNTGRAFPWLARFAWDAIPVPHCSTKPLSFQSKHKEKRLNHISHQQKSPHTLMSSHSNHFHRFKWHFWRCLCQKTSR